MYSITKNTNMLFKKSICNNNRLVLHEETSTSKKKDDSADRIKSKLYDYYLSYMFIIYINVNINI
jgi:hypothetical protein